MLTAIDQIVRQEIDLQGPGVAVAVVKMASWCIARVMG